MHNKLDRALSVIRGLLINGSCSCGGWTCDRCRVTVDEAVELVPDLRDRIDLEREARDEDDFDDVEASGNIYYRG